MYCLYKPFDMLFSAAEIRQGKSPVLSAKKGGGVRED